ncbi:domain found in IF2B/IF5-domain-containing protein [Suillus placidus]|uniref:Domain found in IF2B/IF5-domain-containing protein n=1 Tax=Suillus placidus TaxID=48579 RepID=A0A9P7D2C3_9AGAM|nr:domain found in IF2B/IF5-domain-containing protein [Suillus placidus]
MADVAPRALSRAPTYPTKFFGCELGSQTSFDDKNERYTINGGHDTSSLWELLDVFIDKFVLCHRPSHLQNGRNEDVVKDCKACGVNMKHRLVTFILKNPLKNLKKSMMSVEGETNRTGGGVCASAPLVPGDENVSGDDSDDELTKMIKAEAPELSTETKLVDQDYQVGELSLIPPGGLGDDEGSDDVNSPYTQLGCCVEQNKSEAGVGAVQIYQKVQDFGVAKKHDTDLVLVQTLFTGVAKEMNTYKALLAKFSRLAGLTHPKILMALYQIDWGTRVSNKYVDKEMSKRVRKASEPFLKWL